MRLLGFLVLVWLGTLLLGDPVMIGWAAVGVFFLYFATFPRVAGRRRRRQSSAPAAGMGRWGLSGLLGGRRGHRARHSYSAPAHGSSARSWSTFAGLHRGSSSPSSTASRR